jgi:hypothetical protein
LLKRTLSRKPAAGTHWSIRQAAQAGVDQKNQIQALNRTQPALPMGLGYVEGIIQDYLRHGTTTLFAALDIAVRTWLAQRPRYHMHHTPTYSSWLNQVECWFGLITSSAPFAVVRSPAFKTWRGKSDAFGQHYKCSSRLSLDGYCRFHPVDRSTLSAYFRHAD